MRLFVLVALLLASCLRPSVAVDVDVDGDTVEVGTSPEALAATRPFPLAFSVGSAAVTTLELSSTTSTTTGLRCVATTTAVPVFLVAPTAANTAQGEGPYCDTCVGGAVFQVPAARAYARTSAGTSDVRCSFFDGGAVPSGGGVGVVGVGDARYLKLDASNDPVTGALSLASSLDVDGTTLVVDAAADTVGIGATAPINPIGGTWRGITFGGPGTSGGYLNNGGLFGMTVFGGTSSTNGSYYSVTGSSYPAASSPGPSSIEGVIGQSTAGAFASRFMLTSTDGTVGRARFTAFGTTELVVNDDGDLYSFRVESDTNANMLKIDAINNRVGVGVALPSTTFDVAGTTTSTLFRTGVGTPYTSAGYGFTGTALANASGLYYNVAADRVELVGTNVLVAAANAGNILISAEGTGDATMTVSAATSDVYIGNAARKWRYDGDGSHVAPSLTTGVTATAGLPTMISTAPSAAPTCNLANAGKMVYIDDTDDASASFICICGTSAANAYVYHSMSATAGGCP